MRSNMANDNSNPDTFETTVSAYTEAATPEERRLFLRACLRRLEADAALHAERLRLLVVASAAEGKS
jgi:hypothetical protein